MNHEQYKKLKEITGEIKSRIDENFDVSLILGSGYGSIIDGMGVIDRVKYSSIPGFPHSTIKGQRGEILTTKIEGKKILVFNGRFHFYQGYSLFEVTLPVRVSKLLGAKIIILTNAAGGINKDFNPGDVMIISDHINLMNNPLIGFSIEGYEVFVDMSQPYSPRLRNVAMYIARKLGIENRFKSGVYIATTGPSYETKAEIEFFKRIGADAVGMSTIPEVIVAKQEGLEVFGMSVITNMAAGITNLPLKHEDVLETMEKTKKILHPFFGLFLKRIITFL
ncbi:MAG: purine-nucleoside phosphorylase [Spirochaetes bacterium]|nr:MAG: purine-nucleoside phosphorylase [Spirochaetota bacterium]RKX97674.1 MAG: purine-nucleoside phosphorylase [Spirochaetota bacterium]